MTPLAVRLVLSFLFPTLIHTLLAFSNTCTTPHELIDDEIAIHDWFDSLNSHFRHDQLSILPMDDTVIDPNTNHIAKQVSNAIFSVVNPETIRDAKLISLSESTLSQTLNLSFPILPHLKHKIYNILTDIVSGNMSITTHYIPNIIPYAHCYCGHQFGFFAGQLGDGRALSLGEYHTNSGDIWELQLKGSGKTPFSRKGDGRAVLRSSIREYLMSEYMHSINIATSRAAMIITSSTDTVNRDKFYNGDTTEEAVSIVLRMAPNWIRFGSFELHIAKNNRYGPNFFEPIESQRYLTKSLLDYVIEHHYNDIWLQYKDANMYEIWWKELVAKCVLLVAKWMSVGFVHGVLNTDNMSILGIGIDYGPFGMMEYYQADYVPNYSDDNGRYAYNKQVKIFKWNMRILADALDKVNILPMNVTSAYLHGYFDELYEKYFMHEMKQKFGLIYHDKRSALKLLIDVFFGALSDSVCDMTNAFRQLNMISIHGINQCEYDTFDENMIAEYEQMENERFIDYILTQCVRSLSHYKSLQKRKYMIRTHENGIEVSDDNILFFHLNEDDKQTYDTNIWSSFLALYRRNYINVDWESYKKLMENDSDGEGFKNRKDLNDKRIEMMNSINPKYILRNHMLQKAIDMAENGDYSQVEKLRLMSLDPFSDNNIYGTFDEPVQEQSCDSFNSCDLLSCSS